PIQLTRQQMRVESDTGPKILAPGFLCLGPATGRQEGHGKTGQAKRSLVLSTILFGAWFSHGNF
ncbi:MAG: hypothetical protein ACKOXU_04810, partial [Limnohabitans sp.]